MCLLLERAQTANFSYHPAAGADPRDYEEQEPRPQPKAKAAAEKPAPNKAAASTKAKRKAPAREEPEDEDDDDEEEDDQEEEKPKKRKRKSASAGGGSTISPELQAFLGVEKMGRFQVQLPDMCVCIQQLLFSWRQAVLFEAEDLKSDLK